VPRALGSLYYSISTQHLIFLPLLNPTSIFKPHAHNYLCSTLCGSNCWEIILLIRDCRNWTCARCEKRISDSRYNEAPLRVPSISHMTRTSVSSTATETTAATTTTIASMSYSPARAPSSASDGAGPRVGAGAVPIRGGIRCSMPNCLALTTPDRVFCSEHQSFTGGSISSSVSRAVSATAPAQQQQLQPKPPVSQSQPQRSSSSADRQALPAASKNKLLAENDKDRPITMRKTASNPNPHIYPSAKQTTASPPASAPDPTEVARTTASQSSAPPTFAVPPNASPRRLPDGEPVRKRSRTTPNSAASPEPKPNGTETTGMATSSSFQGTTKYERLAPVSKRDGPRSSSASQVARPGGRQNPSFKLGSSKSMRAPPRKMALPPTAGFTFNYGNESGLQSVERLPEPPSLRWDGHAISSEKRDVDQALPPSKSNHSYWELTQPGNPSFERKLLATAQIPSSKAPSQIPNGYGHHATERNGLNGQCNYDGHPGYSGYPKDSEESRVTFGAEAAVQRPPDKPKRGPKPKRVGKSPVLLEKVRPPQNRKTIDESLFDNLVYRQEGAATPPLQVQVPASPAASVEANRANEPLPPDEPFYADIDPRVHWPQPHSNTWVEAKQDEIAARPRRKANFGKAAQRIREQRLLSEPTPLEDTVPEKVLKDPAWMRVWKRLHGGGDDEAQEPAPGVVNGAGPGRGRRPGPKKQASSSSSNGHANGQSNGHPNGHVNGYTNGATNGCAAGA